MIVIEFDNLDKALKTFNDIKKNFNYGVLELRYDRMGYFLLGISFQDDFHLEIDGYSWWRTEKRKYLYIYYKYRPQEIIEKYKFRDFSNEYLFNIKERK